MFNVLERLHFLRNPFHVFLTEVKNPLSCVYFTRVGNEVYCINFPECPMGRKSRVRELLVRRDLLVSVDNRFPRL
jgi:hypothetical protein